MGLYTIEEVTKKINSGMALGISGDEIVMDRLPKGNWVGGTIPYFMSTEGGMETKEKCFVHEFPASLAKKVSIMQYNVSNIKNISKDAPKNGFSLLIIPAFTDIHQEYAKSASTYEDIFSHPIVGWIAGLHLGDLGKTVPAAYDGTNGEKLKDKAIVMHIELPDNKFASMDIVNLFKQGEGDIITFDSDGFTVKECNVNDKKVNFSDYLVSNKIDLKLPLVADMYGAMINTSFQANDEANKTVQLYAPVFRNIKYRIAKPVEDYISGFNSVLPIDAVSSLFSCNCILNYLYAGLEGKKTGAMTGPMTFGEIGYVLLNQTLVYLSVKDA